MAKKTIKLKKYMDIINEKVAASAITPGMLIEPVSPADTVQAHSTSEGNAQKMWALEDELQGNGINDAYAATDPVQIWNSVPGEEIFAILKDGEAVVINSPLASNGDGALKLHVPDDSGSIQVDAIVAYSLEVLDLSDSSGGESSGALGYDKRFAVRSA